MPSLAKMRSRRFETPSISFLNHQDFTLQARRSPGKKREDLSYHYADIPKDHIKKLFNKSFVKSNPASNLCFLYGYSACFRVISAAVVARVFRSQLRVSILHKCATRPTIDTPMSIVLVAKVCFAPMYAMHLEFMPPG